MAWVYILKCSDDSYYTGWTNSLEKRIQTHASGKASRYTRSRLPVRLIYCEKVNNRQDALRREISIKRLKKKRKRLN